MQVVTSALACLATLCKTDDNAIAIAQHEHIFEALVHVLANVDDRQLNRLAAVTIGNFGSHVAVRPFMRDSGVMQALVEVWFCSIAIILTLCDSVSTPSKMIHPRGLSNPEPFGPRI